MFLKNYTSNVPVSQTIYRIEQVLIKCGVLGIAKEYTGTDGKIAAITFRINDKGREFTVRLPADVEKAQDALWMDYVGDDKLNDKGGFADYGNRKQKRRKDFAEQAGKTAWKIIQDWVEVQMSMIQLQQAESLEVFMPYVVVNGGQSFYKSIAAGGYRALLPERSGE